MKLITILIPLLVFLVVAILGVSLILEGINMELGVEKVPCYDRYGNLIEGLVCDDETTQEDKISFVFGGFVVITIGILMSVIFYISLDMMELRNRGI